MGPIRMRHPSKPTTSLWWKSTFLALALTGCQAPRPVELPPVTEAAPPVSPAAATDRIRSVAEADGAVQAILPPRPDLHPGDGLHISDAGRLIATALVTGADETRTVALVVALTDERRPVRPGDRFGPVPADIPHPAASVASAAPVAAASAAPTPAEPAAEPAKAIAPPIAAPVAAAAPTETAAVEHAPAEPAPAVADGHAAEEAAHASPPAENEKPADPHAEPHTELHGEAEATAGAAAPAAAQTAAAGSSPALQPEVRARLEAERAYWELAARVLRLPAGGPELTALQQRLRTEITAQGMAP